MKFDFNRFRNYGLWVSILALIPMLLHDFGINVIDEQYRATSAAILSILVALGIISNPTTEYKWFRDDENVNKKSNLEKTEENSLNKTEENK